MKYEITIRQLEEYTEEETKESRGRVNNFNTDARYSDKLFHEIRVLQAEVSKEEFEAVKKAIVGIM